MSKIIIKIPDETYRKIWKHLLPPRMKSEEACFLYVQPKSKNDGFACIDWQQISPKDFAFRSGYNIELADDIRGQVIKRAHDLNASLLEMHSHTGSSPARFSPSDLAGFSEFVPHVMWRLRGKPYFAVVVSRGGFDGIAWTDNAETAKRLDGILVGNSLIEPTKLSSLTWSSYGF